MQKQLQLARESMHQTVGELHSREILSELAQIKQEYESFRRGETLLGILLGILLGMLLGYSI